MKRIAFDLVFESTQLKQLEYKSHYMLEHLYRAFCANYITEERISSLLPRDLESMLEQEPLPERRMRLLCDYVAGMTDGFAVRTFKRLFDPDFGSIMDLV